MFDRNSTSPGLGAGEEVLTTGAKFLAGMRSEPIVLGVGLLEPARTWALAGATPPRTAAPAAVIHATPERMRDHVAIKLGFCFYRCALFTQTVTFGTFQPGV